MQSVPLSVILVGDDARALLARAGRESRESREVHHHHRVGGAAYEGHVRSRRARSAQSIHPSLSLPSCLPCGRINVSGARSGQMCCAMRCAMVSLRVSTFHRLINLNESLCYVTSANPISITPRCSPHATLLIPQSTLISTRLTAIRNEPFSPSSSLRRRRPPAAALPLRHAHAKPRARIRFSTTMVHPILQWPLPLRSHRVWLRLWKPSAALLARRAAHDL